MPPTAVADRCIFPYVAVVGGVDVSRSDGICFPASAEAVTKNLISRSIHKGTRDNEQPGFRSIFK